MIKIVGPTNRDDLMTSEEYEGFYTEKTTRVSRHIPGMAKYFANPCLRSASGGSPAWDSIAEMYWESLHEAQRDFLSTQWMAARQNHLDGIVGRLMFSAAETEFENKLPPDYLTDGKPRVKYIAFLNRKDGMSRDDFQAYWFDKHVPLALRTPNLRRYRASVCGVSFNGDSPVGADPDPAPFDGMVEMWFDSIDHFDEARRDQHWQDMRFDYYRGFAMGRMQVLVRENLVFDETAESRG